MPLEKAARGVVQLRGALLADAAEGIRLGQDFGGIDLFLHDRQMLREPGPAGRFGAPEGVVRGGGLQGVSGGGCHVGGFGFSRRRRRRVFVSGQEKLQLGGVELLAFGPEDPAHEGVDFLLKEGHFLTQPRVFLLAGSERGAQFGFPWSHARRVACRAARGQENVVIISRAAGRARAADQIFQAAGTCQGRGGSSALIPRAAGSVAQVDAIGEHGKGFRRELQFGRAGLRAFWPGEGAFFQPLA